MRALVAGEMPHNRSVREAEIDPAIISQEWPLPPPREALTVEAVPDCLQKEQEGEPVLRRMQVGQQGR